MKRAQGFSLIEILVAVAILGVVSMMAFTGLRAILAARDQTNIMAGHLVSLQKAMATLERDFEQAANRPIRDQYGDIKDAMLSPEGKSIVLTRSGYPNPANVRRSALLRVGYHLEEGILYRTTWTVLDGAHDNQKRVQPLLHDVKSLSFRFLDTGDTWTKEWPPQRPEGYDVDLLPQGLELELELEWAGKLTRLFRIPGINATTRKLILIDGGGR